MENRQPREASGPAYERKKSERRAIKEERYSVSFSVFLMWAEKSGLARRVSGRCVDLSPEGMKIEARDRLDAGTVVTVSSDEFGRMGHATVRHVQRARMLYLLGLKFSAAFGLGDPARRRILERVLSPDDPHATALSPPVRDAGRSTSDD